MADDSKIPEGMYCYKNIGYDAARGRMEIEACPYWGKDPTRPEQCNGFCTKLGINDWDDDDDDDDRFTLLWEQVKECCENLGYLGES